MSSNSNNSEKTIYAAGQGREFLRNELEGQSNEFIREFAGLIDNSGVLDLLNYYCGVFEDHGEDFLDTRIGELIVQNAATNTTDRAFREGNVSQLQGMVGLTNKKGSGGELVDEVADRLADEGAIGLVFGSPGAGKTSLTMDAAMTWKAKTGGTIVSNTQWVGCDIHVTSDVELLEAMANTKGPVLAMLDEIAQDLSGFGSGNVAAEQFSDDLLFVRKRRREFGPHAMKGSVLMVAHTRTKTAAEFRRISSFAVEKPSRADPGWARLLESEGGKDVFDEEEETKGLTDSSFGYDEYEPSEFTIERIGSSDDEDQESSEDTDRNRQIKTAIIACEKRGESYEEAAQLLDYSNSWVGDRVREWRNGEHRDLVSEEEI